MLLIDQETGGKNFVDWINQIFNEDCIEGMNKIPDGSVDMILTDPPFQITDCLWDKQLPIDKMWEQFWRVSKTNAAILIFSQLPFSVDVINASRKFYRYEWIWNKAIAVGFFNAHKMPLRCHENILVFYRKLPTYNPQFTQGKPYTRTRTHKAAVYGKTNSDFYCNISEGQRFPRDVLTYNQPAFTSNEIKVHPTQKPLGLLEYLIRTYTHEGDIVLDATVGSGSTAVAAINTGRRYVGFETENNFFEVCKKRIEAAQAEKELELFNF